MERKELKPIDVDEADIVLSCYSYVYPADKADAVMDAMEARIKELEDQLSDKGRKNSELFSTNAELRTRIKELEDKINVLEKQSEVTDRMLQDMANNSNKEFLPDSNKELGTDHFVDANKMMWVSVKDRMPDEGKIVLVYNRGDNTFNVMWAEKYGEYWEWCNEYVNLTQSAYTHWMPLPNPPTAEDSSNAAVVINNQETTR